MADWYGYIQELQKLVQHQSKVLSSLQKQIQTLKTDIKTLQEKPPINVEKLQYSFDQLKVERLDGTLNIGLSPQDLQGIENLDLPTSATQGQQPPVQQAAQQQMMQQLRDNLVKELDYYVTTQVSTVISDTEQQLNMKLNSEYHQFIIDDLHKQLPDRVGYFINNLKPSQMQNVSPEQLQQQLFQQMKADIDQAVYMFINKLPAETHNKGANTDGNQRN